MMKKLALIFFTITFLLGCSNSKDSQIDLFNGATFNLSASEKVEKITPYTIDTYKTYFGTRENFVPLFRGVKGENYTLYLGLPLNTTIAQFIAEPRPAADSTTYIGQTETDSTTYALRKYKISGGYMAEFMQSKNDCNLYVIGVTKSQDILDTMFVREKFSTRIIYKEK